MRSLNLSTIDLNLLVALDALLEERSVTRAASRVRLSQPAMSRTLGRLRQLLDDPLFVRSGRGVEPTPRALELASPLRDALAQIRAVVSPTTRFRPGELDLRITLLTADYIEFVLVPSMLGQLQELAPGVEVRILPTTRDQVERQLLSGEGDLAIWELATTNLRNVPLMNETMLCIAAKDHPRIKRRLTMKLYQSLAHVRVSPDRGGTSAVDSVLAARGVERNVGAVVSSHLAVPRIVSQTELIATLPRRIATAFAEREAIRVLSPPIPLRGFQLDLIWPPRRDADPRYRWIRDQVIEAAARL